MPPPRLLLAALGVALLSCPIPTIPPSCGDVQSDLDHCGACGQRCAGRNGAAARCEAGLCRYHCVGSAGDCNGDLQSESSDGCEVELSTDASHCGGCGLRCQASAAHSTAQCALGACRVSCEAGWVDCNVDLQRGSLGDGCEVDAQSDSSHCGECWHSCATSCQQGNCAGETPRCGLFGTEAPRPVGTALGTDGTTFALVFNDFVGGALWVARLDEGGRAVGAARRVAQVRSHDRFAIAFDGTHYVLAWTDTLHGTWVRMQRLSAAELAPVGELINLEVGVTPWGLRVAGRPGAVVLWMVTSSDGEANSVAVLPTGAARPGPLSTVSLRGTAQQVSEVVAIEAGWLAAFSVTAAAADGGPARIPAIARVGLDGRPAGSPERLDMPRDGTTTLPPRMASAGGGAVLLCADTGAGQELRSLAFDSAGAPLRDASELAWRQVSPVPSLGLALAGGSSARPLWALLLTGSSQLMAQLVRLGLDGAPLGGPTVAATLPSMRGFAIQANERGALLSWVRPKFGVPEASLETMFVTTAGNVTGPCTP